MISTSSSRDLLLRQTRIHFPRLGDEKVDIAPIEKGGSDRKFYRVRSNAEHSLILVKYNLEREENRLYVEVAEFLATNGIRAPRVYFHDAAEGLIWIEDLGETDLWSYRNEDWVARRALYDSALEEVAKLHSLPDEAADGIRKDFPPAFDAALYAWEQQYFFENCLGRHFGIDESTRAELAALPVLQEIPSRLAALPRVLVHRDFQSQNIIVRNGNAYLIDFQGMRPGLAEYDLASLLYDPYVTLTTKEREQLFGDYCAARESIGSPVPHQCSELLRLCALQRLMQALGAYGFLGLVKGNKAFLAHIPAALASLRGIVAELQGAEKLHATLAHLS
ncbi:MAG TPA: phosphotransferase [Chthoniobacterales bacterium]|nr:phosphotransferase [Chthoniobacterales bacterium]